MSKRLCLAIALVATALAAPVHAQTAATENEAYMAGMEWRSVGPPNMSGRVTDVEGIAGTKTFFAAAAAGGIWKTTNNGTTFRPVFDNERVIAMGDLAIAPSNPDVVWAGTGEEDSRNSISAGGGIYKSTDGGLTWELKGLEETETIARIIVHPFDEDIVYVAALGHIWGPNEERGLYRTKDGGDTWELVKHISDKAGFVDLAMHPVDPNILFASSWERVRGPYFLNSGGPGSGLWKSTDGGDSWSEVEGGGFPETMKGRIGIAIGRSNPDIMYALVEAETPDGEDEKTGLYRSEDGGANWEQMNTNDSRPFYYSQVRVDPSDPDFVIWSSTPVNFSKDGGETVGTTTLGVHVDHHALWWDTEDPDHMIVGNDGGIAITWDKGGNWDFPNIMALGQFYAVSYNMDMPYRVCGGLQDNGTWCGPSRRAGGGISSHMWYTVNGGDGFYAEQDPVDHDLMYAESQGGNMARIRVGSGQRNSLEKPNWRDKTKEMRDSVAVWLGDESEEPSPAVAAKIADYEARISADSALYDLRYNWNTPMVISPHDRSVIYAGASKVLKSTEYGDNLEIISPDLSYADPDKIRISTDETGGITRDATGAETHATIVALAESPIEQGVLFAGTDDGRVWKSPDDGVEWIELTERFPGVPEGTWVSRVEPSSHAADRFYVTFDGHRTNDFDPYVYVTEDGGETFRSIASNLPTGKPDFVHVVREDPVNEDLLFVGTDVGAYASTNRGESWTKFMEGLPTVPVHDLRIHPRDSELIAGTHGRSIWIVDIAPLQQLSGGMLAEGPMVIDPKPALQYGNAFVGGESVAQRTWRGDNARYGAEITYYVPEETADRIAEANRERMREQMAEARAQREAGEDAPPPRDGPPQGGRGGRRGGGGVQAQVAVLSLAGDTIQTLTGPATAGLHRAVWNMQARSEPEVKTPSEIRDSVNNAKMMREIADSLIVEGGDERVINRVVQMSESGNLQGLFRGFGGFGGAQSGEFRERPGENYPRGEAEEAEEAEEAAEAEEPAEAEEAEEGEESPGGPGGFSQDELRDTFRQIRRAMRDRGAGGGFGGFGRGGGNDLVDPGQYRVIVTLGEESFETTLEVIRAEGYVLDTDDDDAVEFEEWLKESGIY